MVGGGSGSSCWPLNFGFTHHISRSLLKTLWITHPSGSFSWNAPKPMSFEILKGSYLLLSNFFEGWFNWISLFSNHTLSPTLSPWGFRLFLSCYLFMFFWAFSIIFVACSQLLCIPVRNSSTLEISICITRLPFHGCLPKLNSNGVLPVATCFLSLYWNSAITSHSAQSSYW